jgi:hypothetical protein
VTHLHTISLTHKKNMQAFDIERRLPRESLG